MRNFNYNLQVKDLQRYLKTFSMVKFELDFNFFCLFLGFSAKVTCVFLGEISEINTFLIKLRF